jgi:hypothetical protein
MIRAVSSATRWPSMPAKVQRGVDAERHATAGHQPSPVHQHRLAHVDPGIICAHHFKRGFLRRHHLALGGGRTVIENAARSQDHAAGADRRDATRGMHVPDIIQRRQRFRLRGPTRTAGDDHEIAGRRIADAEIGRDLQAVGERDRPRARRDSADFDLGRDAARHRQHAEGGEIDRLDAVIDENPEPHLPYSVSERPAVSRAASAAASVIAPSTIIMIETPVVPPI